MGKIVYYEDISKETIEDAINFALDSNTQANAKKVAYSFKNRPQHPQVTSTWWVEHVAATGGAPLVKSHSTFMNWYEYNLLDVYVVVVCSFIVFIASWVWILKKICIKNKSSVKVKTR